MQCIGAVSYTHLIERAKVNIKNAFTAKTASHVCKLLDKFGSVYYTHLDVYKRQGVYMNQCGAKVAIINDLPRTNEKGERIL